MNSWDNYYKEFKSDLSEENASFCVSLKETDDNVLLLEDLGYTYAEDADTIDQVGIGEYSFHTYEEFDDDGEVTVLINNKTGDWMQMPTVVDESVTDTQQQQQQQQQ